MSSPSGIGAAAYALDEVSIILNAPLASGVYALHDVRSGTCVYIGEASDILGQLIQHLRGNETCLKLFRALSFSYELISPAARSFRAAELMREMRPLCKPSGNAR